MPPSQVAVAIRVFVLRAGLGALLEVAEVVAGLVLTRVDGEGVAPLAPGRWLPRLVVQSAPLLGKLWTQSAWVTSQAM